jgi:hypothetical protein
MLVICPIFDRLDLLPAYIRYYRQLGATHFILALWNGQANPLYQAACQFFGPIAIRTSVECTIGQYNGPVEMPGLNQIVKEFSAYFRWYCLADLDEFCYFGGRTMPEVVAEAEAKGFTAVHGVFHDRLARG